MALLKNDPLSIAPIFKSGFILRKADVWFYVLGYNPQTDELMAFDTQSLTDNLIKAPQTKGFQAGLKTDFELALDRATAQVAYTIALNNEILRECMEMKEILKEGKAQRFARN